MEGQGVNVRVCVSLCAQSSDHPPEVVLMRPVYSWGGKTEPAVTTRMHDYLFHIFKRVNKFLHQLHKNDLVTTKCTSCASCCHYYS